VTVQTPDSAAIELAAPERGHSETSLGTVGSGELGVEVPDSKAPLPWDQQPPARAGPGQGGAAWRERSGAGLEGPSPGVLTRSGVQAQPSKKGQFLNVEMRWSLRYSSQARGKDWAPMAPPPTGSAIQISRAAEHRGARWERPAHEAPPAAFWEWAARCMLGTSHPRTDTLGLLGVAK
jgi:hypothetical protein